MNKESILVIGAGGQLGAILSARLQEWYGIDQVVLSDIKSLAHLPGHSEYMDATNPHQLHALIIKHQITQIYFMAAVLSATGEKDPIRAWNINMSGLVNVLEASRVHQVKKVFFPSSIGVYGKGAPKYNTPQAAFLNPSTVYGISKSAGENWCQYYHLKYGLDIRSLRYPGVIGYQTMPGEVQQIMRWMSTIKPFRD